MVIKILSSESLNNLPRVTWLATQNLISISGKFNNNVRDWLHNLCNLVQNEVQGPLFKEQDKAIKGTKIQSFLLQSAS